MESSTRAFLSFGWETFKRRPWFFVGTGVVVLIAYLIAGGIVSGIDAALTGDAKDPSLVGSVLNLALSTLLNMGVTAFYLNAHDNPDTVELLSLWHPQPFWKFLGATLLTGLAIIVGLLLLIVPGIIFMLMFMFVMFIVIDRGLGPVEAMKESARITRGYKWQLLGFVLVLALINVLGMLALLVGLFVTIPVTSLAFAHAYRALTANAVAAGDHGADGDAGHLISETMLFHTRNVGHDEIAYVLCITGVGFRSDDGVRAFVS